MSAFSENRFTSDSVQADIKDRIKATFAQFISLYKQIGWKVNVQGGSITITDPDGISVNHPVNLDLYLDLLSGQFVEHYEKFGARRSGGHLMR